ncbi:hypothetical protein FRB94_013791 [Tulasnella sp. JGI-2019a]|nr:hypothetical protein FRB94_013791 [Tulasnella sp. JGI-2019a]
MPTVSNAPTLQKAVGGVLSSSNTVLLIDQYSSASPPNVVSSLSGGLAGVSLPPYLSTSTSTTSGIISSLPFSISVVPGLVAFPSALFQGQASVLSLNATADVNSAQSLPVGSLLLSENSWAAFTSPANKPIVFWDNTPDFTQLPSGLLSAQVGTITLVGLQSATCATPCAMSGQCNSDGKCVCKPGFNGTSCETCAAGFYGPQCTACPSGCQTCDDGPTGSGKCLLPQTTSTCNCANGVCNGSSCTCSPGWTTLTATSTTTNATAAPQCSDCAAGFFKDSSGTCRACTGNCAACSSPSGKCTQCNPGFIASTTDSTACVLPPSSATCPDGSYASLSGGCAACSVLCKTCNGATSNDCITCGSGQAKLNGVCVAVDATGVCSGSKTVVDNSKGKCDACPSGCSSCAIPNFSIVSTYSQVQCTGCLPGSFLSGGRCVAQCPIGQFVGSDGMTCQACDSTCATCAGSSTYCLACAQSNMFAFAGTCTATCPASTFVTKSSVTSSTNSTTSTTTSGGTCSSCHPDCSTCTGANFDQCTTCPRTRPVKTSSGRCLQACGKGQFWDATSGQCSSCSTGCSSCADATANMCMSCTQGMVLQAGKCVQTACPGGAAGLATLGGVCLARLDGSTNTTSTSTSTPTVTASTGFNWWKYLVIILLTVAAIVILLFLWRRHSRKRRALKTKHFQERVNREGMGARGRITVMWDRMIGKPDDDAEARRRTLRAKLRMSKSPGAAMVLADGDLEDGGMMRNTSEDRVEEWRSEVRSGPSRSGRSRGDRTSRTSTLSYNSSRTSGSMSSVEDAAPKRLARKAPPTWDPTSLVPKAPSIADTQSVYSQSTALRRAPSLSLNHLMNPVPKEPLKDSMFDGNRSLIDTSPSGFAPPPIYQFAGNPPVMLQVQPPTTPIPVPMMASSGTGYPFQWQTPVATGLSNGTSTSSRIGDKNPFRTQM